MYDVTAIHILAYNLKRAPWLQDKKKWKFKFDIVFESKTYQYKAKK